MASNVSHKNVGEPLPEQTRFIADADAITLAVVDGQLSSEKPAGFWLSSWRSVRTKPLFIISGLLLALVVVVVLFPGVFTSQDPHYCELARSSMKPTADHWFGTNLQGCDIFARTIYGARASVSVGIITTVFSVILGTILGMVAGFYGGWLDSVISRINEIFFALPLILAAIVVLQMFETKSIWTVSGILILFCWTSVARIARGSTLAIKDSEFITAARALGLSKPKILVRHILPNILGPLIVLATLSLGGLIVVESTLSYLGVGLPASVVSWGTDISAGSNLLRAGDLQLFYPAGALAITVLAFMMMGDALRDAFDPKSRNR